MGRRKRGICPINQITIIINGQEIIQSLNKAATMSGRNRRRKMKQHQDSMKRLMKRRSMSQEEREEENSEIESIKKYNQKRIGDTQETRRK